MFGLQLDLRELELALVVLLAKLSRSHAEREAAQQNSTRQEAAREREAHEVGGPAAGRLRVRVGARG